MHRSLGPLLPFAFSIALFLPAAALALQPAPESASAPDHLVPGDSHRGSVVFRDKGCSTCHQVRAGSARPAPTLAKPNEAPLTAGEIAARLWNHGPLMWESIRAQGLLVAPISPDEMSDLFAFLLQMSLIDSPGDASLGELLFAHKGCGSCHRPGAGASPGEPAAPSLHYWGAHTSPLSLARAMWNHAEIMRSHVENRGQAWPRLDGQELSHIVAYVRRVNTIRTPSPLVMGNPVHGREAFIEKGCASCHAASPEDGSSAPGMEEIGSRSATLADLAARMWSHYPDMVAALEAREAPWRPMTDHEMTDVVTYLFAVGHMEATGDPNRGKAIFLSKLCAYCHAGQNPAGGDLAQLRKRATPAEFACALWAHGPQMAAWMKDKGIAWPELDRQAIMDLLSYLSGPQ